MIFPSSTETEPSPPNSVDFHWPNDLPSKRETSFASPRKRPAGAVAAAGRVVAGRVVEDLAAGRGGSELDSQAIRVVTRVMMTTDWRNMVLLLNRVEYPGGSQECQRRARLVAVTPL